MIRGGFPLPDPVQEGEGEFDQVVGSGV
jgi:hypothetical protein